MKCFRLMLTTRPPLVKVVKADNSKYVLEGVKYVMVVGVRRESL